VATISDDSRARQESRWFDQRVAKLKAPRKIDVLADYHLPVATFGAEGNPRKGNHRWWYYALHHQRLAQFAGKRVLHVACGFGELALYMAHLGLEVVAFDFSPTSVEFAREMVRLNGLEDRITVDCHDVRTIPYAEESFDLVTGEDALHHIIKYEGSLEPLYRVLKRGGSALFCDNFAFDPIVQFLRPINWRYQEFANEHSLGEQDLEYLRRVFDQVRVLHPSYFYTWGRLMTRPGRLARAFSRSLRRIDELLLPRLPILRRHYSLAMLELLKHP
jgi:ubiquinone/menaquinone biosynthesis C-methylase UbiE